MSDTDSPEAVIEDARALAMELGVARAGRAVRGEPASPELDEAAERVHAVMLAAGESLNADAFGRRVRARRRMDALRKRKAKPRKASSDAFPKPPPVKPFSAAATRVVRRG